MKHNTTSTAKFKRFIRLLRPLIPGSSEFFTEETVATGLLERLWHATILSAPEGDIGKIDNETLAEMIGWRGSADALVELLVEATWLDRCSVHRLVVHDWAIHCPSFIKGNLAKHSKDFAVPQKTKPNLTKPNLTGKQGAKQGAEHTTKQPTKQPAKQPDRFESFWDVVHRKTGKGDAHKAFTKAVDRVAKAKSMTKADAAELIIATMKVFAASNQASHDIKGKIHPATWLNGDRFEDDVATWNESDQPQAPERKFLPPRKRGQQN